MASCRVRNCGRTRIVARCMCDRHYKRWKRRHIKGFLAYERRIAQQWRDANRIHLRKLQRASAKRLLQRDKAACYKAYGGYICRCCGETIREFLTLDHIKG